jgi:GT2 family glycosyltransferase
MIPAVVIPALSNFDMLEANLATFDAQVERLVIIDNSQTGYEYQPPQGSCVESVSVIRPILNVGVTGGFNDGICQTPGASWWLLSSVDIGYGPGDLANIAKLIASAGALPAVVTGSRNDDRLLRGAYMAVNQACIRAVGLYDEWAFFPCYFEDDDYVRRCELGGVRWIEYDGTIKHDRSITIRTDAHAEARNRETYPDNLRRYIEKWGGQPRQERFMTPYDMPVPLSYTRVDLPGRAARHW